MPQIWLLLGLRYHPREVNRARRERDVIANGQFILTTREAYDAVGTHAAVRHEVAEDLALAQAYLRHGRRIHFAFAERLMETRMYQSLPQLVEGWSKNVYLGGRRSFPEEPARRALVPVDAAGSAGLLAAAAAGAARRTLGAGVGALAQPALVGGRAVGAVLGADLVRDEDPGGATGCCIRSARSWRSTSSLRSTWRGERRVEWRGRVYGTPEVRTLPSDPATRSATSCCAGIAPPSTRPAASTLRWNSTLPIVQRERVGAELRDSWRPLSARRRD